ncbi:hypothetical protein MMC28_011186 [Mycoblastus sanguinarius]|nr:hypothetical protein [Mycoblastus sanguinarius]
MAPRKKEDFDHVADSQGCYALTTRDDGDIGIGMCVWSTGNMMNPFVQKALEKTHGFPSGSASITSGKMLDQLGKDAEWMIEKNAKTGVMIVDDRLRVLIKSKLSSSGDPRENPAAQATMTDVFALGDNAMILNASLPATAQTASQEALWLAKRMI